MLNKKTGMLSIMVFILTREVHTDTKVRKRMKSNDFSPVKSSCYARNHENVEQKWILQEVKSLILSWFLRPVLLSSRKRKRLEQIKST